MLTAVKWPDLVALYSCQAHVSLREELCLFPAFPLAAPSLLPSSIFNSLHVLFPSTGQSANVHREGLIQIMWYFGIIA